jgi:hypothetical protein
VPIHPDIRFCTAADGAKIAVGTYGSGPVVCHAPIDMFTPPNRMPLGDR